MNFKKTGSLVALAALTALVAGLADGQKVTGTFRPSDRPSRLPAQAVSQPSVVTPAVVAAAPSLPAPQQPETLTPAQRSLEEMAETVASATNGAQLKGIVERLQRTGQQPRVIRDANADSGEMIVVRAGAPLEGTRYFHAQYFVGEDNQPFVQHMSFEFAPGPNAMKDALAAVSKNFPGLSQPTHQRDGYARWQVNENQILWVKQLTADDVKNDPFNAYSKKDLGAVRVALEQEIHH